MVTKSSQVRHGVSRTAVELLRAPDTLSNSAGQGVCCDQCALDKIQLMAALVLTELQPECISYGNKLQLRERQGVGVRKVQVFRKRGEVVKTLLGLSNSGNIAPIPFTH